MAVRKLRTTYRHMVYILPPPLLAPPPSAMLHSDIVFAIADLPICALRDLVRDLEMQWRQSGVASRDGMTGIWIDRLWDYLVLYYTPKLSRALNLSPLDLLPLPLPLPPPPNPPKPTASTPPSSPPHAPSQPHESPSSHPQRSSSSSPQT